MGNLLKCMSTDENNVQPIQPVQKAQLDKSQSFDPLHGDSIVNSVVTTDDCWISVSGGEDGHVVLFDWLKGEVLQRWTEHKRAVNRLAFSSKSGAIFSGSRDGSVLMWQPAENVSKQRFLGHELTVNGVAACSSDANLLFSGSRDWTVRC